MPEMKDDLRDKMVRLQQFQQQLQALSMQKQSIQVQQAEISNALKELEKVRSEKVYELIGNILINRQPQELMKLLKEKQERINLRIESIDKQLKRITSKVQELQKEVTNLSGGNK